MSEEGAALSYEAARDELAEVVRRLEAGGLSLEDSLALWERGELLAATCERYLAGARERIESVIAAREQQPDVAPLPQKLPQKLTQKLPQKLTQTFTQKDQKDLREF
ncbi:MAG: exodeoxyribonuclease VII small subunit [Pseudonocardiales bacterium]|nr:exodeoxyribonuclease VII small subunit [Pseudonocardiales bacterium]